MTEKAFTPCRIGPVELPNRLALAPLKTALGGVDGRVSSAHVEYYRRRAVGGVGLIIVEPFSVDPRGKEHPRQLEAHEDHLVAGMSGLVAAVHSAGSVVFAHLNHAGRAANPSVTGVVPEAPSAVSCHTTGVVPVAMSRERIREVLQAYEDAARRTAEAGFDGVELQLGLGYLPAQFLSPRTNLRDDEYGGDEDGRWRFARRLVRAVRDAVGSRLALTARLSADEEIDGGLTLANAVELGRRLHGWGVDALHVVTGSVCDSPAWYYQHMALPAGVNETFASVIRDEVAVPVLAAGRLGDPERIRSALDRGLVDVIALGRPLVADPDLPRKMASGREDEIIECGGCLQGCLVEVKRGGPIRCIVNPDVGRETFPSYVPVAVGRRVVVVGGGPAGMQAALSARRQGESVTLFERRAHLGGQFVLASASPGKSAMARPLRSLVRAVERAGVDLRLGLEASAEAVLAIGPHRVVVATGSRPVMPSIPGLDYVLTPEDVITRTRTPGRRVLIIGGGMVGVEVAELLGLRGHVVVVVERLASIAGDMEPVTRAMTLERLGGLPVTIHTSTRVARLEGPEVFVDGAGSRGERLLGIFDSVVTAMGHRSYDPLSETLRRAGVPVTVIGDADRPGRILEAVRAGAEATLWDDEVPAAATVEVGS